MPDKEELEQMLELDRRLTLQDQLKELPFSERYDHHDPEGDWNGDEEEDAW